MVLADLGKRINSALSDLNRASAVDEQLLDTTLKSICAALLESDVNVKLVSNLRQKIKNKVIAANDNEKLGKDGQREIKRNVAQKAVFDELVALVDPTAYTSTSTAPSTSSSQAGPSKQRENPNSTTDQIWKPKKGQSNVIMFVGLQGSGKTTSCTKLAVHYQRRGFRTCLVCADTFRAGAFDQLKQNAAKAKVPFFGSYTETDPVAIAASGVQKFKKERFEVIIVDTSGRHRQESELFEEMKQIDAEVEPDLTIMVLDASIGQAAEAQSQAFKEAAGFGAIIVTKMDGHAKGGGAISAVAATKTPIMFIGTGEHLHDLERFSPNSFVSKMLGMGDVQGLMEMTKDLQMSNPDKAKDMMKRVEQGIFTIRDMKEQLSNIMNMGPLSKIASMIPGMGDMMGALGGSEEDASRRMRRMIYICDSMSTEELDSDGSLFRDPPKPGSPSPPPATNPMTEYTPKEPNRRALRVARGSGTSVREVEEVLAQHLMFQGMIKKAGGKNGWMTAMQNMQKGGGAGGRGRGGMPSPQQIAAMQKMMPPGMKEQMREQVRQAGGMSGMMEMMKNMGMGGAGGGGFPGLPGMGGGGGGGGGMPDMAQMQKMMQAMGMGGMG